MLWKCFSESSIEQEIVHNTILEQCFKLLWGMLESHTHLPIYYLSSWYKFTLYGELVKYHFLISYSLSWLDFFYFLVKYICEKCSFILPLKQQTLLFIIVFIFDKNEELGTQHEMPSKIILKVLAYLSFPQTKCYLNQLWFCLCKKCLISQRICLMPKTMIPEFTGYSFNWHY